MNNLSLKLSYGLICFKIENLNILFKSILYLLYNNYINIDEYNYLNINNISKLSKYYDNIKFLMVMRKYSFNYIVLLRGKYKLSNIEEIKRLLSLMTKTEHNNLLNSDFDDLWNELWQDTSKSKIYIKEYNKSKKYFKILKDNNFYDGLITKYDEPEWEFPKGQRNTDETKIDCAIREFEEETNILKENIIILDRIDGIEEQYIGTDNKTYIHTYYLSTIKNNKDDLNLLGEFQQKEIGDIKWLSLHEVLNKTRDYHNSKKELIYKIYFFILNLIKNKK
jgi:8-oxo-dGTP pyrophosphatase MutT (NUDIX family)